MKPCNRSFQNPAVNADLNLPVFRPESIEAIDSDAYTFFFTLGEWKKAATIHYGS
jgi:hypothetical protein